HDRCAAHERGAAARRTADVAAAAAAAVAAAATTAAAVAATATTAAATTAAAVPTVATTATAPPAAGVEVAVREEQQRHPCQSQVRNSVKHGQSSLTGQNLGTACPDVLDLLQRKAYLADATPYVNSFFPNCVN